MSDIDWTLSDDEDTEFFTSISSYLPANHPFLGSYCGGLQDLSDGRVSTRDYGKPHRPVGTEFPTSIPGGGYGGRSSSERGFRGSRGRGGPEDRRRGREGNPYQRGENTATRLPVHELSILHNIGRDFSAILPVSEQIRTKLEHDVSQRPGEFVMTILFTLECDEGQERGVTPKNKQKITEKEKKRKKRAAMRRRVLSTSEIQCIECNQMYPFQGIRHAANKREFLIISCKNRTEALQKLGKALQEIEKRFLFTSFSLYGPTISEKDLEDVQKKLRKLLVQMPTLVPSLRHATPTYEDEHLIGWEDEYLTSMSSEVDPLEDALARVTKWIKEREGSVPKTEKKLRNAVLPLLKVSIHIEAYLYVIPTIVNRLDPTLCNCCGALVLQALSPCNVFEIVPKHAQPSLSVPCSNSRTSYVIPLEEEVTNEAVPMEIQREAEWRSFPGRKLTLAEQEEGMNEIERKVMRRAISVLQTYKNLPTSREKLAKAIRASCSSFRDEIPFEKVFQGLLQNGIVSRADMDGLVYH